MRAARLHGSRSLLSSREAGLCSRSPWAPKPQRGRCKVGRRRAQRVGYKRSESGLAAWIEGTVKGQLRHIDFTYARVACAH